MVDELYYRLMAASASVILDSLDKDEWSVDVSRKMAKEWVRAYNAEELPSWCSK